MRVSYFSHCLQQMRRHVNAGSKYVHRPAGRIVDLVQLLTTDGDGYLAQVEWTSYDGEYITKGMKFGTVRGPGASCHVASRPVIYHNFELELEFSCRVKREL
jgi:hypothetical protein